MDEQIQRVMKQSMTLYNEDISFLRTINNNNLSEAVRSLIKEYKRLKNQEYFMQNFMKIMVGVLILVIAFFFPPLDPIGMGLTTFGSVFVGLTIFKIVMDWRKRQMRG